MKPFFETPANKLLYSLSLLMLLFALASYAILNFTKVQYVNESPATISVTGSGEVVAVPDVGQFSFSVTAEAETAELAQEQSGTAINDILSYLEEEGINEKDIKTQNYNLNPRYKYVAGDCPAGSIRFCPEERVLDGFAVSQTITVKVRSTDEAPGIIAGVGSRGATNISGLDFTIDDVELLQAEARAKAITDAKEKAMVLAAQLGVNVVRLDSYSEGSGGVVYQSRTMAFSADEEMAGFGGAELPVGEESTTVNVVVTYVVE